MTKYMILYNTVEPASETMAKASPEQQKMDMNAWVGWKEKAEKIGKFNIGMPVKAVSRITSDQVTDSYNETSGYSMIEGDKDEIVDLLRSHPHLKTSEASIDLLEILPIRGM